LLRPPHFSGSSNCRHGVSQAVLRVAFPRCEDRSSAKAARGRWPRCAYRACNLLQPQHVVMYCHQLIPLIALILLLNGLRCVRLLAAETSATAPTLIAGWAAGFTRVASNSAPSGSDTPHWLSPTTDPSSVPGDHQATSLRPLALPIMVVHQSYI
jgi:hypothetical protein